MTPLLPRIEAAIRANGPMPVSLYMLMCLHDPQHGYYATRPALNADFTTAPETSQAFGELLGLWAAHEWREMGSPSPFHLIELGPGRGVMMADALRAARSVPGFAEAVRVALIEASPVLRAEQLRRLNGWSVSFFTVIDDVPSGPAIILANEFLDCMGVHQAVRTADGWRERQVGLRDGGGLRFGLGPPVVPPDDVAASGGEVEWAPALEALLVSIAHRFRAHDGRALLIDYGPADHAPGDTLRAFRAGAQVDPLAEPGACDLTADVDFGRLVRLARLGGMSTFGPVRQVDFLARLGIAERGQALAAANPARAGQVAAEIARLTDPGQMGERFKAVCLAPDGASTPPGF